MRIPAPVLPKCNRSRRHEGRGILRSPSQEHTTYHTATTDISKYKYARIKLDFNLINSNLNSEGRKGALQIEIKSMGLQIITNGNSMKISGLDGIQKCQIKKLIQKIKLIHSKFSREVMWPEVFPRAFRLSKPEPKWLTKDSRSRWGCIEKVILGVIGATGVWGRDLSSFLSQGQIMTYSATATIHKNKCTRIKIDFNSIKSSFNSREKNEALQVMKNEISKKISAHNANGKCKLTKSNSEMKLIPSGPRSEIKELSRGGPVQGRFYLRNHDSNWLVLGAVNRWDCRDELNPGEVRLTRNRTVAPRSMPGSVHHRRSRAIKEKLKTVIFVLTEGTITKENASYSWVIKRTLTSVICQGPHIK